MHFVHKGVKLMRSACYVCAAHVPSDFGSLDRIKEILCELHEKGSGENYLMRSLMISTTHSLFFG